MPPGQVVYQQNCQMCHGANRQGTDTGVPLVHPAADPANNIAAGAPRFDAAAIRAVLAAGKSRMPPFPHLSARGRRQPGELPEPCRRAGADAAGSAAGAARGPWDPARRRN